MGRGVIILLAASLGLNFLVFGYLLNDWVDRAPPQPPAAADFRGFDTPRALVGVTNALPPDSRRAFRAAFRQRLPDMRAHHREMRGVRLELRDLLEADEWDGEAVAAKMAEIQTLRARQHEAFDEAFLAAVNTLSAEDRRRMIEYAEERRAARREQRKFGPPDRP